MEHIHHARDERSSDGGSCTITGHLVNIVGYIVGDVITRQPGSIVVTDEDGIGHDILLEETAEHVDGLVLLHLIATALTDNLHVDAIAVEAHILFFDTSVVLF